MPKLKILWKAQEKSFVDMRNSDRDVCTVTRQPLLSALLEQGHEIVFLTNYDHDEFKKEISAVENEDDELWKLNETYTDALDENVSWYSYDDYEIMAKEHTDIDAAVCELRTQLYFHDKRPADCIVQDKVIRDFQTLIWDKDLWMSYEKQYLTEDNLLGIITPSDPHRYCENVLEHAVLPADEVVSKFDFAQNANMILYYKDQCFSPSFEGRDIDYGYIGSQYNREDAFHRFFTSVAKHDGSKKYAVVGKFYDNVTSLCPNTEFIGRTPMYLGPSYLRRIKIMPLLAPRYYSMCGHITYRPWELAQAGVLAIGDPSMYGYQDYCTEETVPKTPAKLLEMVDYFLQDEKAWKQEVWKQREKLSDDFRSRAKQLSHLILSSIV